MFKDSLCTCLTYFEECHAAYQSHPPSQQFWTTAKIKTCENIEQIYDLVSSIPTADLERDEKELIDAVSEAYMTTEHIVETGMNNTLEKRAKAKIEQSIISMCAAVNQAGSQKKISLPAPLRHVEMNIKTERTLSDLLEHVGDKGKKAHLISYIDTIFHCIDKNIKARKNNSQEQQPQALKTHQFRALQYLTMEIVHDKKDIYQATLDYLYYSWKIFPILLYEELNNGLRKSENPHEFTSLMCRLPSMIETEMNTDPAQNISPIPGDTSQPSDRILSLWAKALALHKKTLQQWLFSFTPYSQNQLDIAFKHAFSCFLYSQIALQEEYTSVHRKQLTTFAEKYMDNLFNHLFFEDKEINKYLNLPHHAENNSQPASELSPGSEQKNFESSQAYFGQEFEYYLGENERGMVKEDVQKWSATLEEMLNKDNIHFIKKIRKNGIDKEIIDYNLGEWQCKIFLDDGAIEVITSPYKLDHEFRVNGKPVSVYELFDRYIIRVAKEMKLIPRSKHLHLDTADSFTGGNALLFRMLLWFESNSWLPVILDRLSRKSNFLYYTDYFKDTESSDKLQDLATTFNKGLKKYQTRRTGSDSLHMLKTYLSTVLRWCPGGCNLSHLRNTDKELPVRDIEKSPKTTVEMRVWHGVLQGAHVRLIDTLVLKLLSYLASEISDNKPVEYKTRPSKRYSPEEAIKQFRKWLQILELDYEEYKPLIKILSSNKPDISASQQDKL